MRIQFRRKDASIAALEDACWHRLLPLSRGRLHNDQITCGYHGLVFDGDGRCTHMPSQETLNPAACVRAFPVVEKHRFVWLWPGDPALADPAKVPDLHWNDHPAWAGDGKLITVNCDYRLVLDNLMDLTHETYVHGSDRWQIIRFEAPCTIAIDVGVPPAGSDAVPKDGRPGDRSKGVNGFVLNTITPQTERSCHEDELILEAQQRAIDERPGYSFYNLNIDAGSMWARRLIDALVKAETPAHERQGVIPLRAA